MVSSGWDIGLVVKSLDIFSLGFGKKRRRKVVNDSSAC